MQVWQSDPGRSWAERADALGVPPTPSPELVAALAHAQCSCNPNADPVATAHRVDAAVAAATAPMRVAGKVAVAPAKAAAKLLSGSGGVVDGKLLVGGGAWALPPLDGHMTSSSVTSSGKSTKPASHNSVTASGKDRAGGMSARGGTAEARKSRMFFARSRL